MVADDVRSTSAVRMARMRARERGDPPPRYTRRDAGRIRRVLQRAGVFHAPHAEPFGSAATRGLNLLIGRVDDPLHTLIYQAQLHTRRERRRLVPTHPVHWLNRTVGQLAGVDPGPPDPPALELTRPPNAPS